MSKTHIEENQSEILPADPQAAVQAVMKTIGALQGIYLRENEALDKADTQSFLGLQDEKFAAARIYQVRMEALLARRAEMKNVPETLKRKLAHIQSEFSALAKKNMEALERMQRCADRLGGMIRRAAKDAASSGRARGYGETGTIPEEHKKAVSMGISETA